MKTTTTDYEIIEDNGREINVPVIRYNILKPYKNVVHGFSTRDGGVSKEHLSSMNLSFSRGDDRENVIANHRRFAKAVGYDENRLVFSDQVHKTEIYKVSCKDAGKGFCRESDIKGIDALMTDEKNIPLMTFYADCVPVFFYDNEKKVIALAHSGWRGTVGKISKRVISAMNSEYGCLASDIVCAIGPSICQSCYEVSEDVINEFKDAFDAKHHSELFYETIKGKYRLNLQRACQITLLEAGVNDNNIAMPDLCTCCNSGLLFSHRATNGRRGNLAAVMMLV